jgi:hypothetical protein
MMRTIIEIAVLLYMLSMIGKAEQDGFRDGLNTNCEVSHGRI